jgi:hypothetical protein
MPPFDPMNWFRKKLKIGAVSAARISADVHCAKGNWLKEEGRMEEAATAYRRAIEEAFAQALNGRRLTDVEEFDLSPRHRPAEG